MDFWNRLFPGLIDNSRKPATTRTSVNDPQARLARFRRIYNSVVELCNRPRNLATEGPLLENLHAHLDRLAALLREESRAPAPHTCVQFAGGNQIYAVVARAATVSQHEPVIRAAVAILAALVDSEEEDFLASGHFAKSMMRFIRKVLDAGTASFESDTETAILELLFTIAARIRLQPDILPVWFQSTARPELDDVYVKEKKTFVGITQKDDFPLCYLLMDRVHREGRTGDFARTGLLYIFEATGRSMELEEWVVSSDLSTLMASGLGALYSQLSRELSLLHPDAMLPAVLAMSDYSTMHPRATAASAFSEQHKTHMATFLLYLAFWQDVLNHCKSDEVKQTLLDHFQILFLQQLLYPSLLQSSDTDAGSSVAVLTYMTAILEALEYPDLVRIILNYLLAIKEARPTKPSGPETSVRPQMPPRSPTSVRRRQSLILLNAPQDPDDAVDPDLFNLVDLVNNNLDSQNSQSVFAALRLSSAILSRHKKYALGSLLRVQITKSEAATRTTGALDLEVAKYSELALSLHHQYGVDNTYQNICEDLRYGIETQFATQKSDIFGAPTEVERDVNCYLLADHDPLFRSMQAMLHSFFTNNVDVNLALTEAIVSMAKCAELRPDNWLSLSPSSYSFAPAHASSHREWQVHLNDSEVAGWANLCRVTEPPIWSDGNAPILYKELKALAMQLDIVRYKVPNLDQLIAGRKNMLQAANLDTNTGEPPIAVMLSGPAPVQHLDIPRATSTPNHRNSSRPSSSRGRTTSEKAINIGSPSNSESASAAGSRAASSRRGLTDQQQSTSPPSAASLFKPPPPETPSTTDVLMQAIEIETSKDSSNNQLRTEKGSVKRTATLNHILTNAVVLQEFVLEVVAILQVRAAVFGEQEISTS